MVSEPAIPTLKVDPAKVMPAAKGCGMVHEGGQTE